MAANPKRLGAEIGILSVLHTWVRTCCSILMFTASFRREDSRRTNAIGSLLAIASFCQSRLYAVSFAASLSMD